MTPSTKGRSATPPPSPEEVVKSFIGSINAHDVPAILGLLSASHRFIDSLGTVLSGVATLDRAWRSYFGLFPDYRIEAERIFASGATVAVFGTASGSLPESRGDSRVSWRLPAAWRALVAGESIEEWQVYADNKPVYELLGNRHGGTSGRPA